MLFGCCLPLPRARQLQVHDKTDYSYAGRMTPPVIHISGNIPDALRAVCTASSANVHMEQGLSFSVQQCRLRIILIGPAVLDPTQPDARETARMRQLLDIEAARCWSSKSFIIMWHPEATEDAGLRAQAFSSGANMVTFNKNDVEEALSKVLSQTLLGSIECEWCGMRNLTEDDYYLHQPLYHVNDERMKGTCQICHANVHDLAQHLHDDHAPFEVPIRTGVIALTVVRRPSDGKFLVVQERERTGYFLPGGGVDQGESLTAGALREVTEEAGISVKLIGVLEVLCQRGGDWRRIIFYAEPVHESAQLKTVPDRESAGACWVDVSELKSLHLRARGEFDWLHYVAQGGPCMPLQIPAEYAESFQDLEL